ncbi:MAG: hypothetical protein FWG19_03010, partial [Methanomassiliicoccaceae archaeon]|nr:hypothetical protein [Methanomassiliicoccaceae archaeon]
DFSMLPDGTGPTNLVLTIVVEHGIWPLENVEVEYSINGATSVKGQTDANGVLEIDSITFGWTIDIIDIVKPHYVAVPAAAPPAPLASVYMISDETLNFVMEVDGASASEVRTVTVRVMYLTHMLNGATVSYEIYDTQGNPISTGIAVPGANDGEYEITGVPLGSVVHITNVVCNGYETVNTNVPLTMIYVDDHKQYDVHMNAKSASRFSVTGVVEHNGLPLPGVDISFTIGGHSDFVTTDQNGAYTIPNILFGSTLTITDVSKAGYDVSETMPLTIYVDSDKIKNFTMDVVYDTKHTVEMIAKHNNQVLSGVTISYTLIGPDGVTILSDTVLTDASGSYKIIDVPFGSKIEISSVSKTNYIFVTNTTPPAPAAIIYVDKDIEHILVMIVDPSVTAKHKVSGTVDDHIGNALSNVIVSYTINGPDGSFLTSGDTYTDVNGEYEITNIPFGSMVYLRISKTDYVPNIGTSATASVYMDDDKIQDFTMISIADLPEFVVSGKVKDQNGNELSDVIVSYTITGLTGSQVSVTSVTDASGEYVINDVRYGSLLEIDGTEKEGYRQTDGTLPAAYVDDDIVLPDIIMTAVKAGWFFGWWWYLLGAIVAFIMLLFIVFAWKRGDEEEEQ